jgi:ATP-dependent Clp protease ATP-binding subunit ClpC
MTYKFTDSAKRAIEYANKIALKLGHSYIGTEHLLYGLASEEIGIASKVLEKQSIMPDKVLTEIENTIRFWK